MKHNPLFNPFRVIGLVLILSLLSMGRSANAEAETMDPAFPFGVFGPASIGPAQGSVTGFQEIQAIPTNAAADWEFFTINNDHYLAVANRQMNQSSTDINSKIYSDSGQRLGNSVSQGVPLGDVDGDGDLDVFVANDSGQANRVWLNDGDGNFSDSGQSLGSAFSKDAALGDVDGDGDLDAFVANGSSQGEKVWLNDGAGNFSDNGQSLGNSNATAVELGDLDGDGDLDAFIGAAGPSASPEPNKVWLNDGAGNFSDSGQSLGSGETLGVAVKDLDGDGDLDAFAANTQSPDKVWLNDGAGNFTDSTQTLGNSASWALELGDLDGDGDLDAFVANVGSAIDPNTVEPNKVWLNDGSGNFSDSGQNLGNARSIAVALGDADDDGDLDAFVGNVPPGPAGYEIWLNDGAGNFSDSGQSLGDSPADLSLGDVNGDGGLDAFLGINGPNQVWLNENQPALGSITIVKEVNKRVIPFNKSGSQAEVEHSEAGLDGAAIVKADDERLILWNKLGSQTEVDHSAVGLDGTFNGGGFTTGMFGDAYIADHTQDSLVAFPQEVIPTEAGTIEFWAKLVDFPADIRDGGYPAFVRISDGHSSFEISLNSNDGAGGGGLAGRVGHGFQTATGDFGSWTYEQVLGTGQAADWHHYALVWDQNGLSGVDDGSRKVAVYLDGQLESGRWIDFHGANSELVPLTGGELNVIQRNQHNQGSVAIDNLKIWDFAKTDFSDRFDEESGQLFDFTGDLGDFSLFDDGLRTFSDLTTDSYTVTEIIPNKWTLLSIVCDNGLSIQAPNPPQVTIDLQPGQNVVCTFTNDRLPPVDLISLTATAGLDRVTLTWETASEIDVKGFNIWRSETETGQYVKINDALIPPRGNIDTGAGYEYVDTNVVGGQTYYYKLQVIDTNDVTTLHGPASATPGQTTHQLYLPVVVKDTPRSKLDFYSGRR